MAKVWTKAARLQFRAKMLAAQRAKGHKPKATKRKRNGLLLTLGNPTSSMANVNPKALAAYKRFHGVAPLTAIPLPPGMPDLIAMGDLRQIIYAPTRGHRKGPEYFHKFGKGAILAATVDGVPVLLANPKKPFKVDFERGIIG